MSIGAVAAAVSNGGIADEEQRRQLGIGGLGEAGFVRERGEQARVIELLQARGDCRGVELSAGGVGMGVIAGEELLHSLDS